MCSFDAGNARPRDLADKVILTLGRAVILVLLYSVDHINQLLLASRRIFHPMELVTD